MNTNLRAALSLGFWRDEVPIPVDEIHAATFIEFLRRNRVPVATLGDSKQLSEIASNPHIEGFLSHERSRHDDSLASYSEVHREWSSAGIQGVLIKSGGAFPYTSDNVDVLVGRESAGLARDILQGLDYVEIPHLHEPYKRFFRAVGSKKPRVAIHLHTEVAWISRFLDGENVVRRAVRPNGDSFSVPSSEDFLMINAAHWFYEDKEMKLRDLLNTLTALRSGIDWDYVETSVEEFGWKRGLEVSLAMTAQVMDRLDLTDRNLGRFHYVPLPKEVTTLLGEDARFPIPFPRAQSKIAHFRQAMSGSGSGLGEHVRESILVAAYAALVRTPFPKRPVLIVAISGPDGSGKTTTAHELVRILKESSIPAEYHWTRPGSSRWLDFVRKGVGRAASRWKGTHSATDVVVDKRQLEGRPGLRRAWAYVLGADFAVSLWASVLKARTRGGVHIFDRFSVDAAADLVVTYGVSEAALLPKICPDADVGVLLDVTVDEALRRAATPASEDYLRRALRIYKGKDFRFDLIVGATPES